MITKLKLLKMKTINTTILVKTQHIASLLLITVILLSGCRKNFMDETNVSYNESKPLSFTTQLGVITRGTPINDVADLNSMGVFAAATGASDWNAMTTPNKMFNERLNNQSGKWTYADGDVYWGAKELTDRYTFFAYAPYAEGEAGNGITITSSKTSPGIPGLKYTVPTDVTKQPDLMVAVPQYNMRPVGNVPLQMKHALTGIGFQIAGSGDEKITGISISGVSVSEYLLVDGSSITWTSLGAPANTNFSASLNYDAGKNYYSVAESMSNNLIASDGYLMMIPQKLGNDAKVKITFLDNSTREISLNTHTWEAGKRLSYLVTLTGDGTITVTPDKVLLPYTEQKPAQQFLTVHAQKANGDNNPNAAWRLTAAEAWLKLSLNPNGDLAQKYVSGKGTQNVYLVADENSSTSQLTSGIYLGDNPMEVVTLVTQMKKTVTTGGENGAGTPASGRTYVGAFWRANETGERLIRINSDHAGEWTASVIWMDGRWGVNDGIILDMENIDNNSFNKRGISFTSKMNPDNYGTPEDYPVIGSAAVVTGEVTGANKYIIFRIGLKSQYTPTSEHPARYAVILLSYANNTMHQKIFLRQGENADYLMKNGDALASGSQVITSRTMSKKFAVYNLTAAELGKQVAKRGAIFTKYPTQAGALWRWGVSNHTAYATEVRMAFSPLPDNQLNFQITGNIEDPWDDIKEENEVSPPGYRRPTDGRTSRLEQIYIEGSNSNPYYGDVVRASEMRQSLFWRVSNGFGSSIKNTENSIWGYYADGFFDRRMIVDGEGYPGFDRYYSMATVAKENEHEIAHMGALFFNPIESSDRYNASIFFPAPGNVSILEGKPYVIYWGGAGNYWSSTSLKDPHGNGGLELRLMDTQSSPFVVHRGNLQSIRPVAE